MPTDPRRMDKVRRYQPTASENTSATEGINAIGMVCSLVGLLIKVGSLRVMVSHVICVALLSDEVGSLDWCLLLTDLHGQQQVFRRQEATAKSLHVSVHILHYPYTTPHPYTLHRLATSSLVMVYMQNPAPMTLSLFG